MKIPQSLLDRREELSAEIEYQERQLAIVKNGFTELNSAIGLIADEPEAMAWELPSESEEQQSQVSAPTAPTVSTSPASPSNTGASGQRAPRRDIKTLVMDELTRATQPQTAKEIAKVIMAGQQSTTGALEHWKAQGAAVEVDGKWHRNAAAPAPAVSAPAAAAPTDPVAVSTQDKLVEALKAAGAAGMTDDELAKIGIPYVSVMQYHRLGWLRLDAGRYSLAQPA